MTKPGWHEWDWWAASALACHDPGYGIMLSFIKCYCWRRLGKAQDPSALLPSNNTWTSSIKHYCCMKNTRRMKMWRTEKIPFALNFLFPITFKLLLSSTLFHICIFGCLHQTTNHMGCIFSFFWQYWGLNSGSSPWALFVMGVVQDRVSWTICPGRLWTTILLIARITGVSHVTQHGVFLSSLTGKLSWVRKEWGALNHDQKHKIQCVVIDGWCS
jgi:hypothetical protein